MNTRRSITEAYDKDIRNRALIRVRGGETAMAVARDMGMHYSTLYSWMQQAGMRTNRRKRKQLVSKPAARDEVKPPDAVVERNISVHDAIVFLRQAQTAMMQPGAKLSRANLLALLALDSLTN